MLATINIKRLEDRWIAEEITEEGTFGKFLRSALDLSDLALRLGRYKARSFYVHHAGAPGWTVGYTRDGLHPHARVWTFRQCHARNVEVFAADRDAVRAVEQIARNVLCG